MNNRTAEEILSECQSFRKGAKWVLTLLDMEMEEIGTSTATKEFVSDFITKTLKEI